MAGQYQPILPSPSGGPTFDTGIPTPRPPRKKKKKNTLTVRQYLAKMEALKQADSQSKSFGSHLKGFGKGALGGATFALTQIMRPSWAVSAATNAAWNTEEKFRSGEGDINDLKSIASAAKRGFAGKERMGMGEVLAKHGVLKGHATARGVAGFGLDVFTDPLMALSLAAAPETGGASLVAYTAAKAAGKSVAPKVLRSAAREAGRRVAKGETDDALGAILKDAGPNYVERLGQFKHNQLTQGKPIVTMGFADLQAIDTEAAIIAGRAGAEAKLHDPRSLYVGFGSRKHSIGVDTRVPLLTTPGKKLANKNIPIISQLSDNLGRAFVPGFETPIQSAGKLARDHAARQNALTMRDGILRIFGKLTEKLDQEGMLNALHHMEQPLKTARGDTWKAVITRKGEYTLNSKYMDLLQKRGLLSNVQREFVEKYFKSTEYLRYLDEAAGLEVKNFAKSGRMYVPHTIRPGEGLHEPTIAQKGLFTKAGYEKGREAIVSLKQVRDWIATKEMPDVMETDPLANLWRRTRAGSERQADQALINTIKTSLAVPTKLVNVKTVGRVTARLAAAEAKHEGAIRGAAQVEQGYHDAIEKVAGELAGVHAVAHKSIQQKIKNLRIGARTTQVKKLQANIDAIALKLSRARKPENIHKLQAELDAMEKHLGILQRRRIVTPGITRAEAQKLSLDSNLEVALKDLANPKSKAHKSVLENELAALKAAKEVKTEALGEIRAAKAALATAKRGKKNPAFTKGLKVSTKSHDEWGNPHAYPPETFDQLHRLEQFIAGDQDVVDDFAKGLGKWMGNWKILVTTVNPGYRIRNTMTDLWNMWVSGVPVWAIGVYGKQSAKMMLDAKNLDPIAVREITNFGRLGLGAGVFAGDVQDVEKMFRYLHRGSGARRDLAKNGKFIQLYTQYMGDMNRNAENWGRLTHYLYRTKNLKQTPHEAAQAVKIAHFDYEDLTPFEQRVMKKIFPFYTWTRKNIPYQVRQLVAEPGRYSAFPKMAQEAQFASGNPNDIVPGYVDSGFGIPIGRGRYYMPQFGVSDLSPFQGKSEAWQRFKSLLGPQIKIPAEIATGRSLFTGQDIAPEGHTRVPISGRGAAFMSLLPGSNVGPTQRSSDAGAGTTVTPGVNPWFSYFGGQIPGVRAALGIGAGTKERQNSQLMSYFAGQSVQYADPKQQAYYASQDILKDVDRTIDELRGAGLYPRPKHKKSEIDKLLESILGGNYGG